MTLRANRHIAFLVMLTVACASTTAHSQSASDAVGALQGFALNRHQMFRIERGVAFVTGPNTVTYSGGVRATLGATVLRSQTLTVHYSDSDRVGTLATLELGPDGAQRIGRLEASGSVTIAHGAHSARSDAADFDLRANRITLTGHVVDISNAAVLRGYHLVTDLTTGISRIESAHQRRF